MDDKIRRLEEDLIAFSRQSDKITADEGARLLRCADTLQQTYNDAVSAIDVDKADGFTRDILDYSQKRRRALDDVIEADYKAGTLNKKMMLLDIGDAVSALREAAQAKSPVEKVEALGRAEEALQSAVAAQLYLQLERACQPPAPEQPTPPPAPPAP